jgi:hypothetical protein
MTILKDFIRMVFGLPDDAHVPTWQVVILLVAIVVVFLMVGLATGNT